MVKQAKFLFQIAPRGNTNPDEVVEAMKELQAALEWLGAGAKTAVGYGRMRDNVEQFEALQQKLPHQITETEFVTMTAAPSGTTVQVATEKEELVRCTGLPHIEAKANWGTGATLFLAQVTRRDGIAVKAVWDGW